MAKVQDEDLSRGSVYFHSKYGLIYIIGGSYIGGYDRVSNFWQARKVLASGKLGKKVGFYGEPMVCLNKEYKIETTVTRRGSKKHSWDAKGKKRKPR